jgi:hypothetical protein
MSSNPPSGGNVPVIIRGRITKVEAEKYADIPVSGLEINVHFDTVVANNQLLEVYFTYTANFKERVGKISMTGFIMLEMDPAHATQIANLWKTEHRFEDSFASSMLNNIHYKCGTEAILPAKVVELPSPIMPQRIGVTRPDNAPGAPPRPN